MKKPFFSILLPVYNGEDVLVGLLNSISNQSYKNFEVLVCDDCSNDASVKYIEEWVKDTWCTVIFHKNSKNLGVGLTQLKNLKASSGDFVVLAAQDHIWHHDRLQETAHQIINNEAKLICTAFTVQKGVSFCSSPIYPGANILPFSKLTLLLFRSDLLSLDTIILHKKLMKNYEACVQYSPAEDIALILDATVISKRHNHKWVCVNKPMITKINLPNSLSKVFAVKVRDSLIKVAHRYQTNRLFLKAILGSADIIALSKLPPKERLKQLHGLKPLQLMLGFSLILARFAIKASVKIFFWSGFGQTHKSRIIG